MRILSLKEVEDVLTSYYRLRPDVAKRWAEFYVNKNFSWNHIHVTTNMAIYRNSEPEQVLKLFESWTKFYEAYKNETKVEDSG